MDQYKQKEVKLEAVQLTKYNADEVAAWCGGRVVTEFDALDPSKQFVGINFPTLDGPVRISEGDYLIKGLSGEFFKSSAEMFESSFDLDS